MPHTQSDAEAGQFRDKARQIADWLEDKQAKHIVCLDVSGINSITDAVVLVSATSWRHAQTLADWVLEQSGRKDFDFLGQEGYDSGSWLLLDLNEVVVHIFLQDYREFYNLEGLWRDAEHLCRTAQDPSSPDRQSGQQG